MGWGWGGGWGRSACVGVRVWVSLFGTRVWGVCWFVWTELMQELRGIPVSSGVAIGRVFLLEGTRWRIPRREVGAGAVDGEVARLDGALARSLTDLGEMRSTAEAELGSEAASIFAFHQGMLCDPSLVEPMRERIRADRVSAEYAAQRQFEAVTDSFRRMADATFRTKVGDVWDLHDRVLGHLMGGGQVGWGDVDDEVIVVASDLTPSQAAELPRDRVLGFVTGYGGPTSHTAIFARALGIPACVGVGRVMEKARPGDVMLIDGDTGSVVLEPDEETVEAFRVRERSRTDLDVSLGSSRELASDTSDGVAVSLHGNIEFGREAASVITHGGSGVGLFRTEFLWLTRKHEPTEAEQFEEYKAAVEGAQGHPVTIRTLDLGADKYTQSREAVPERNPFLGMRSIRHSLAHPEVFKEQLRAILRVSALGPVRVMFPLVTKIMEVRAARLLLRDVMEDLAEEGVGFDEGIEVGMMVEAPSAAVMASAFAREVDFFSIGTNDLVQYTLAVDRTNERVADMYSPAHPGVLRLIKDVVRAARRRGVDCSVCGEMAGDPMYTMLLIGIGLRSLSATPALLPGLKRVVRSVSIEECERLARTVGSFESEGQVQAYLLAEARKRFPELVGGRSVGGGG